MDKIRGESIIDVCHCGYRRMGMRDGVPTSAKHEQEGIPVMKWTIQQAKEAALKAGHVAGKGVVLSIAVLTLSLLPMAQAGVVHGPDARLQFEGFHSSEGDSYVDFEAQPAGPLGPLTVDGVTVTVRTTQVRFPSVANVDYPVSVLPFSFVSSTPSGTHELMGTTSPAGTPDGQSRYEIRFSEPQGRAGVQRNWHTNSMTRFYNADGDLLGEHQNTANREFVGYIADGDAPGSRVTRIEIDGLVDGVTYQVGFTDDLFFGQGTPVQPPGEIVFGQEARDLFDRAHRELGDTYEDFDEVPNGPVTAISSGGIELTLATTLQRYPPPAVAVNYPVVVLPYSFVNTTPSGTNELMGTRATTLPDGQSRYEIRFSEPQRRAGIRRHWNTFSVTRFYNAAGELLGEHRNTQNNEFVGLLVRVDDRAQWVARVEIDGLSDGTGTFQVGRADDLYFGTAPLEFPVALRILTVARGDGREASLTWEPAVDEAWIQFSPDLRAWDYLDGPIAGDAWTGLVPEGAEANGFLRVTTEAPVIE